MCANSMRTASLPILAVTTISILMLAHLYLRTPVFPFSPDSASYIEQARSLIQEGSTLTTSYGPDGVDKAPSTLFPIGYPIVLALISMFGIDARESSVVLGWVSAISFPALLFISFRKLIGSTYAVILVGLSAFSPGVLQHAPMGLTDMFSLMLAVSAIGLVLNSRSTPSFLVSGLVAGFAYAVRNAHIALLASLAIYFLYLWVSNPVRRAETSKQAVAFVVGVLIVILPLLLRNLMIFGALNPYEMEPSTVGVIHNMRTYVQEFIYDLSTLRDIGIFAGWSIFGLAILSASVLGGSGMVILLWAQLAENRKKTIFLCITYSFIGAIVVIAARSRYEWGEMINVRHTMQYTPFFWAAFLAAIPNPNRSNFLSFAQKILLTIALFLVALHIMYALRLDNQEQLIQKRSTDAMNAYRAGNNHLCISEANTLLVSNWSYVFRIQCAADVRFFNPINPQRDVLKSSSVGTTDVYNSFTNAILDLSDKSRGKPIRAGFFPGRKGVETGNLPLPKNSIDNLQSAGWIIVQNDKKGLLLTYIEKP
jgi:hypothetical protein